MTPFFAIGHSTPAGLNAIGIEPASDSEAAVEYRFNEGTNSAAEPATGAPTCARSRR